MDIIILSPHLDDAALSCSDHIHAWNTAGHNITVVTIFSSFQTTVVSDYLRGYMEASGITTVEELEHHRKQEDAAATQLMGCRAEYLDFIDAGYRQHNDKPDYADYRELCPFRISEQEYPAIDEIVIRLSKHSGADLIVAPLGVGGHIDHLMTRLVAEKISPDDRLAYYVDFPYALNPFKWRPKYINTFLSYKQSIQWISTFKRSIIDCYPSQVAYLFRMKPRYPEILLFRNNTIKQSFKV